MALAARDGDCLRADRFMAAVIKPAPMVRENGPPPQGDPVVPLVTAIEAASSTLAAATETLTSVTRKLTTDGTVKVIVGEELPRALNQLVWQRWWWLSFVMAAFAVGLVLLGAGVVWWHQPTLTCGTQSNGGIYCGYWQVPGRQQ
jgi:hypothetical protein